MARFELPPAPGRFIEVDGLSLHYVELGDPSAPPLLAIHGLLGSHTVWQRVQEALSAHYRLILLDLPGHGYSTRDLSFSMLLVDQAKVVAGFMRALGVERFRLLGHSMGGAVSMLVAANHPDMVEKLVTISSVSYPFDAPLKGRLGAMPVLGYLLVRYLYRRPILEAFVRDDVYHNPGRMADDEVDLMYAHFNTPEGRVLAHRGIVETQDPTDLAANIERVKVPTLVLWGRQDALVPASLADRLVPAIDGAQLHIFEDCGHIPMMEAPEGFAARVLAFLQDEPAG